MLTMVHSHKAYGRAGAMNMGMLSPGAVPLANDIINASNYFETSPNLPSTNPSGYNPVNWDTTEKFWGNESVDFVGGATNRGRYYSRYWPNVTQFTFSFWLKRKTPNTVDTIIFSVKRDENGERDFVLLIRNDANNNEIQMYYRPLTVAVAVEITSGISWEDKWYYFVVQRVSTDIKLYRDGVELLSLDYADAIATGPYFVIGGYAGFNAFNGYIQHFVFTPQILPVTPPVRPWR